MFKNLLTAGEPLVQHNFSEPSGEDLTIVRLRYHLADEEFVKADDEMLTESC
jgi:hypothetical protein